MFFQQSFLFIRQVRITQMFSMGEICMNTWLRQIHHRVHFTQPLLHFVAQTLIKGVYYDLFWADMAKFKTPEPNMHISSKLLECLE